MKAINAIPGEQEQSSPGGAPGQANAQDEEAEGISATCITLAAACRAERGLSVAFGGSPKRSHPSHCLGTYPGHRAESCRRPRGEISLMGGTCDEAEIFPSTLLLPMGEPRASSSKEVSHIYDLQGVKIQPICRCFAPQIL